jgi:hypothetical protein
MKGIRTRIRAAASRAASMASSPSGWLSFALANLLVSMLWIAPLAVGWLTGDSAFYVASAGIFSFMSVPLSFAWLLVYALAERIDRTINYKKRKKVKEDRNG